jgi:hypothetical protein
VRFVACPSDGARATTAVGRVAWTHKPSSRRAVAADLPTIGIVGDVVPSAAARARSSVVNGSLRGAKEQRSFKPQAAGSIPAGRIGRIPHG